MLDEYWMYEETLWSLQFINKGTTPAYSPMES